MRFEDALEELLRRARRRYPHYIHRDLRDSSLWGVLSALRGPDATIVDELEESDSENFVNTYTLKELTTARIRAILGIDTEDTGIGVIIRKEPLTDDEIVLRNRMLKKIDLHFTSHFTSAMAELKDLGYDVPEKELNFTAVETEELTGGTDSDG